MRSLTIRDIARLDRLEMIPPAITILYDRKHSVEVITLIQKFVRYSNVKVAILVVVASIALATLAALTAIRLSGEISNTTSGVAAMLGVVLIGVVLASAAFTALQTNEFCIADTFCMDLANLMRYGELTFVGGHFITENMLRAHIRERLLKLIDGILNAEEHMSYTHSTLPRTLWPTLPEKDEYESATTCFERFDLVSDKPHGLFAEAEARRKERKSAAAA